MRRRRRTISGIELVRVYSAEKRAKGRANQLELGISWKRKWKRSERNDGMKTRANCYFNLLLIVLLEISLLAGLASSDHYQLGDKLPLSPPPHVDGTTPNVINKHSVVRNEFAESNPGNNKLQHLTPATEDSTAPSQISSTTSTTTNRPTVTTDAYATSGGADDAASQLLGKANMDVVDYILAADLNLPTSAPESITQSAQVDAVSGVSSATTETNDQDIDQSNPLQSASATTSPRNTIDEPASLDESGHSDEASRWSDDGLSVATSTDTNGQLVRNRKSSDNSTKLPEPDQQASEGKTTKAPGNGQAGSGTADKRTSGTPPDADKSASSTTASPANQPVQPTFGSLDYDDFDLDYQLKMNTSGGESGNGAQQNLNKRDYDSMSTVKPPNWSALIRQPHVFASTAASRSSNETSGGDFYHHQAPPMIPSLLTVKSTQLTNQELDKVRPQFLLFQDDTPANVYNNEQSQALANGDLLATASGTGMINTPVNISSNADAGAKSSRNDPTAMISLLNGSPIRSTEPTVRRQETPKPLFNGTRTSTSVDQPQVTTIVVDNMVTTEAPAASGQTTSNAPISGANQQQSNGNNSSSIATLISRQAGQSQANQWYNYPHPNLHHNPLLLHHILNKPSVYAQHVGANHLASQSRDSNPNASQSTSGATSTSTSNPMFSGFSTTPSTLTSSTSASSTGSQVPPAAVNIIEKPTLSGEQSNQPAPINRTQLQMQLNEMRAIAASSEFKQQQQQQQQAQSAAGFLRPASVALTGSSNQPPSAPKQGLNKQHLGGSWHLKVNQPLVGALGSQHLPRNIYQASPMALRQSMRQAHNHFARFSPAPLTGTPETGAFLDPFNGMTLVGGGERVPMAQQNRQLTQAEFSDRPLMGTSKIRYPPANFNVMHHLFGNNLASANLNLQPMSGIRAPQMMAAKSFGEAYQNQFLSEPPGKPKVFAPMPPHLAAAKHHPLASLEQSLIAASGLNGLPQYASAYPGAHQHQDAKPAGGGQLSSQIIAAPSLLREVYAPRPASMPLISSANVVTPCPQQLSQRPLPKETSAEALLKQLSSAPLSQLAPAASESTASKMSEEDMSTYVSQLASLSAQQQQPSSNQQPASSMDQPSWQMRDSPVLFNPANGSPSSDSSSLELQVASLLQQLKPANSSLSLISNQSELENLFLQKPSDSLTMNGLQNSPGQQASSWADLLKHAKLIGLPDDVQAQIYREHLTPLAMEPPPALQQQQSQPAPISSRRQPNGPPYSTLMAMDTLASNKYAVHQAAPVPGGTEGSRGLVWRQPANEVVASSSTQLDSLNVPTLRASPTEQTSHQNDTSVGTGLSPQSYYSLDGHQRQQKKDREQQEELQRQRQKQIAFIEALRSSLMRMQQASPQEAGSTPQNKNSYQTDTSDPQLTSDTINNLTLAGLANSQDEFDEQSTNPIPDWLERQLIQESLVHESARVHPFGHTAKKTYIGRHPLPLPPPMIPYTTRPGAMILRPAASNPHASHLGPRPVYPLMPLAPPPTPRIFPPHHNHHFDGHQWHHNHASPISTIRHFHHHIGQHNHQSPLGAMLSAASQPMSSLQTGPYGGPMMGNPTRLMLDRFPLASAPAYLIKLPTLTGGTITASGSLVPPTSKLMRVRPGSPLRLLNVAASMAPQRMKLVSSMMQSAPSIAHALHQAPPPHHMHHSPISYHGYHRPPTGYTSLAAMPSPMFAPPPPPPSSAGSPFEIDAMHSLRPVPIHLHPLHPHQYMPGTDPSQSQFDQINQAQSNQQSVSQSSPDLINSQSTSGTSSTFAPSNASLGTSLNAQQSGLGSLSLSAALPATSTQARINGQSSQQQQPVDDLTNQYSPNSYYQPSQSPNGGSSSYSISSGNHQLTLSGSQSPQSSAVNALNRLQQATASLVELTSLASLVEEMVGGSDIESSPAAVLANAISSLTAAQSAALNAQATTNGQTASTNGVPNSDQNLPGGPNKPPLAPFSWKNLLAASIWRDKSSGKARDLGALERLVVAARRPNAARLKVKYIRVPVAVYETTSNGGANGENNNGNQLVTKTQLAEILAQNGASTGGINFNSQPVNGDTNMLPASNSATTPMASVTPVNHLTGSSLGGSGGSMTQANPGTNNNNNNQNHHHNSNTNSVSEASSADYLFDELSADSAPHIALALHDHYLSQPADALKEQHNNRIPGRLEYLPMLAGIKPVPVLAAKKLVSLGSSGLSPLESALYYTMLDPNASSGSQVEVKPPKSPPTEKKRKKKKGKKEEDEDESEDDEEDDDLLSSNDLPLLETAISTLIHGAPPHMQHGGPYQNPHFGHPGMHPSQMSWRGRSPFGVLRGAASNNVETYASPNSPGFSLNPFGKHSHRFSLGEVAGAWGARKLISSLLNKRKVSRTSKREASQNGTTRTRPSSPTSMSLNEAKSSSEKPPNLFYTSTEPSTLELNDQTTLRYPLISPHDLGIVRSTRKPSRPSQLKFTNIGLKPSSSHLASGSNSDNFSVQLNPKLASHEGQFSSSNITTSKPVTKRLDYDITSSSSEGPPELKQADTEAPVQFDFFLKPLHDKVPQSTTTSTIDNSTQLAPNSDNHELPRAREKERSRKDIMAMPLYYVVADHFNKLHSGSSSSQMISPQRGRHDHHRRGNPSDDKDKKAKKS